MQPGPLTKPPSHRSLATPSFRVIDFGRTFTFEDWVKQQRESDAKKNGEEAQRMGEKILEILGLDVLPYWRTFEGRMSQEMRDTRKELQFDYVEVI